MKKLAVLALSVLMIMSSLTMFISAALKDGDVIVHDKFDGTLKLDYADRHGNSDVVVKDGKLNFTSVVAGKFYAFPYEAIKDVQKFTIEYDYEFISNTQPTNAGHTLYFAFGVQDPDNAMYVGFSNINGTEHLGGAIAGTYFRKYRSHYYADDGVTKTSSAVLGKTTFNVKIEVDGETTRVYIDGNRFILADKGEDWKDEAQVTQFIRDGKFGLVSRGMGVVATVDNLIIRAGVGLAKYEEPAAVTTATATTPATTTTTKPVTTKGETTAPQTSDATLVVFTAVMMVSALTVVVLRKKASAK